MDITLLAVDDSLLVTELIREYFASRGYRVFTAGNGRDGLAIAEREVPDLIVSDVNMPIMTGWQLCEAVKKNPGLGDIPFIFLTVEGEDTDVMKGIALGAAGYLTKPFSFDELRASVEAALASSGRGLPGDAPEPECSEVDELCAKSLPEILSIFLGTGRTGTLHVERRGEPGFVGFSGSALTGARFGAAAGPVALVAMMSFSDAKYRFSPEGEPGSGGFPDGAGADYLATLQEALPDWADLIAAIPGGDPVVRLGPKYAAMDVTSLLDLATAGFHRTGAKKGAHPIMPVFEAVFRVLKRVPAPLSALVSGGGGADVLHVLAHLARKKIVVPAP